MIRDLLEPAASLVGTLRTRLADRPRRLRGHGWEVHAADRPGHVVICRPGCWRSRTVLIDRRDVERVFMSLTEPTHEGWLVTGSPGRARVVFKDGRIVTYPVSARDLARALTVARDADAQPAAPTKATTVDVRIGDVELGTLVARSRHAAGETRRVV